jgi:hypothetical protein
MAEARVALDDPALAARIRRRVDKAMKRAKIRLMIMKRHRRHAAHRAETAPPDRP